MPKNNSKVVYATKTGHSKKIAETIAKELNITAKNIKEKPEIKNVDILFIVGGIYGGQSLPELLQFVQTLDKDNVKKVVLITSCTSKNTPQTQVRTTLQEKGINVIDDEFICQGSFLFFALGHPNKSEISNAVEYVKKYINI